MHCLETGKLWRNLRPGGGRGAPWSVERLPSPGCGGTFSCRGMKFVRLMECGRWELDTPVERDMACEGDRQVPAWGIA